jgi:predicted DNA-binding transcriptional regulator YafY
MEYHVRVNGLGEIAWWVLGYGETVEVIAPPTLRKRVAEAASAVLQKYPAEGR